MIGAAEIEDMRLDLEAREDQARLCDAAMAPLNRHWATRGATSVGTVSRICAGVFARSADRPVTDWKTVVAEAVGEAGFGVTWNGDEVTSLEART